MSSICIGVSNFNFTKYTEGSSGELLPSDFVSLGDGVDVQIAVNTDEQLDFVARFGYKEKTPSHISGATATITTGRLNIATSRYIFDNNDEASTQHDYTRYWRIDSDPPICGFGFLAKMSNNGKIYYNPVAFPKVRFVRNGYSLHTQEEEPSFQTETFDAQIFPAITTYGDGEDDPVIIKIWKMTGQNYRDKDDALLALENIMMGITVYPY